jgi:hypothetical protein
MRANKDLRIVPLLTGGCARCEMVRFELSRERVSPRGSQTPSPPRALPSQFARS